MDTGRTPSESYLPRDERGEITADETQRQASRDQAIADRRLDGVLNGAILAGVGLPTMIWHLCRGRRLGAGPGPEPDPRG